LGLLDILPIPFHPHISDDILDKALSERPAEGKFQFADTGLIDYSDGPLLERLKEQETCGVRLSIPEILASFFYTSPERFTKSFSWCGISSMLAWHARFQRTSRRYALPYLIGRKGLNHSQLVSVFMLGSGKDATILTPSSKTPAFMSFMLHLMQAEMFDQLEMTKEMFDFFLELALSRRSDMKSFKVKIQRLIPLYGLGRERIVISGAIGEASMGTPSITEATAIVTAKDEFMDEVSNLVRAVMTAEERSSPLFKTMISATPSQLGFLESILEGGGFLRGSIEGPFIGASAIDFQPVDRELLRSYYTNFYLDIFRSEQFTTELGESPLPLIAAWGRSFEYNNLVNAIHVSRSAGHGPRGFKIIKQDGKFVFVGAEDKRPPVLMSDLLAVRGIVSSEMHRVAKDSFDKMEFKSKGKGITMFFHFEDLRLLMENPLEWLYLLSPLVPGGVGFRDVANKDPRIIFLIPLVIHLLLYPIALAITKSLAPRGDIFVSSPTSRLISDHALTIFATALNSGRFVPIADDWADWDYSIQSWKSYGIVRALHLAYPKDCSTVVHPGMTFGRLFAMVISRSVNGIFTHRERISNFTYGVTQVRRLASGSPLTSISGSVENSAQVAMIIAIMYRWLGHVFSNLDPRYSHSAAPDLPVAIYPHKGYDFPEISVTRLQLQRFVQILREGNLIEKGSKLDHLIPMIDGDPADFALITFKAVITMGDDLFRLMKYQSKKVSFQALAHLVLAFSFNAMAALAVGSMKEIKSLVAAATTFVRVTRALGQHVPRFSVTLFNTESTFSIPKYEFFKHTLSRIQELIPRGASPFLALRFFTNWFRISCYEDVAPDTRDIILRYPNLLYTLNWTTLYPSTPNIYVLDTHTRPRSVQKLIYTFFKSKDPKFPNDPFIVPDGNDPPRFMRSGKFWPSGQSFTNPIRSIFWFPTSNMFASISQGGLGLTFGIAIGTGNPLMHEMILNAMPDGADDIVLLNFYEWQNLAKSPILVPGDDSLDLTPIVRNSFPTAISRWRTELHSHSGVNPQSIQGSYLDYPVRSLSMSLEPSLKPDEFLGSRAHKVVFFADKHSYGQSRDFARVRLAAVAPRTIQKKLQSEKTLIEYVMQCLHPDVLALVIMSHASGGSLEHGFTARSMINRISLVSDAYDVTISRMSHNTSLELMTVLSETTGVLPSNSRLLETVPKVLTSLLFGESEEHQFADSLSRLMLVPEGADNIDRSYVYKAVHASINLRFWKADE
jgi:hypothetical protein